MGFKVDLVGIAEKAITQVEQQLPERAFQSSIALKNASLEVLRGQRSGRVYRKPGGGKYTASAPGEPPAVRTGTLRRSWRPVQSGSNNQNPAIETTVPYTGYLENGTPGGQMAPRPFVQRIVDKALPEVKKIYEQDFDIEL